MEDIKITVQMSAELFEEFMQFRKDKDTYDSKAKREIESLRSRMTNLAKAVIESSTAKTQKDKKLAKEDALEFANDWFS